MTKQEILDFINRNQTAFLATADGDTPHVRGLLIYRADESGILFHTGSFKRIYHELLANPKAEFCFWSAKDSIQVRVNGVCDLVDDIKLKQEIVQARDFLKPWIETNGYEQFAVFRMTSGIATVWTFATNFQPNTYIPLS